MNFQDLKKIEKPDFYLDVAFRKASKKTADLKKGSKGKERIQQVKNVEIGKIEIIKTELSENLKKILVSFPTLDALDIFYLELIKCTLDYASLKKSLGSVAWAIERVDFFFKFYKNKIKKSFDYFTVKKYSKEFYGRISSILKQISPYLAYIEESRRTMKTYPAIKTSLFTVCIFGFPNVGKSTILSKLTTSKPEINSYPFTTKTLNLGYIKEDTSHIQILDTPGTLNRFEKLNSIELQAYLVLKHLANNIIYVFDPTLEYELEKQEKLLERVQEFGKPIILYMSKTDMADKNNIDIIRKNHSDIITDIAELKKKLIEVSKKANKKLI